MKAEKKNSKVIKETTNSREYKIKSNEYNLNKYWDDGLVFYPRFRRGYKNSNRSILRYQMRMYRTWKHNRKTQWF